MIEIKIISEERWKDYRDLRLEALKKEPLAFSSSYEESKDKPESEWRDQIKNVLFALDRDKLVGMIVYIHEKGIKTRHVANIYGVYLDEEFRGQGVGRKLMDAVITQIRKNPDVVKIKIAVNPVQKAALKLYKNFGFYIVGQSKKALSIEGKFYDELIMEKLL
jgi:ribosomal protein S18 acetylase RimI-like enzyme